MAISESSTCAGALCAARVYAGQKEVVMFSNRPIRLVVLSLGVAFLCIGGGIAANEDNRPRTEPVTGTFTASPQQNVKQHVCQGTDGMYLEIRGKFAGAVTSSDS